MRILDTGNGWKVYALWLGSFRVVFSPTSVEPFSMLRECMDFVATNS